MVVNKHLDFQGLRNAFADHVSGLKDTRQEGKVKHLQQDVCLSALAMMFFQDPSMLAFQTRLKNSSNKSNLQSLFGVKTIPQETQLKDILDHIPSEEFYPVFNVFLEKLRKNNLLKQFQFIGDAYLVPIDGTQYFSSEKISCPCCLKKELKNGKTHYSHQVVAATIVHPDFKQAIPLAPEPIKNSDGSKKQDCERNAGKRLLKRIHETHADLNCIILGDDLYSNAPFISETRSNGFSYIYMAKPTSHTFMFECLEDLESLGDVQNQTFHDRKGRIHTYKWYNGIPLNKTQSKDHYVNFFEYTITTNGKISYRGSWVTDIQVTDTNITKMVKAGRSRWKIENEAFNTMKNKGYHADHNFGHGDFNLSLNFFLINLITFFMHQIGELSDPLYIKARNAFSSRKEFWNQLRCTIRIIVFSSWEQLLLLIIDDPP